MRHDIVLLVCQAVDNDVCQYSTVDGRLVSRMALTPSHHTSNYTRSYYINGGDTVVSGSSNEDVVRLCAASTGQLIDSVPLYPGRRSPSLFVQSLRGSSTRANTFSVLVHSRRCERPYEMVQVDLSREADWTFPELQHDNWARAQLSLAAPNSDPMVGVLQASSMSSAMMRDSVVRRGGLVAEAAKPSAAVDYLSSLETEADLSMDLVSQSSGRVTSIHLQKRRFMNLAAQSPVVASTEQVPSLFASDPDAMCAPIQSVNTDMIVRCDDGVVFKAHRHVLCARWRYAAATLSLSSAAREDQPSQMDSVTAEPVVPQSWTYRQLLATDPEDFVARWAHPLCDCDRKHVEAIRNLPSGSCGNHHGRPQSSSSAKVASKLESTAALDSLDEDATSQSCLSLGSFNALSTWFLLRFLYTDRLDAWTNFQAGPSTGESKGTPNESQAPNRAPLDSEVPHPVAFAAEAKDAASKERNRSNGAPHFTVTVAIGLLRSLALSATSYSHAAPIDGRHAIVCGLERLIQLLERYLMEHTLALPFRYTPRILAFAFQYRYVTPQLLRACSMLAAQYWPWWQPKMFPRLRTWLRREGSLDPVGDARSIVTELRALAPILRTTVSSIHSVSDRLRPAGAMTPRIRPSNPLDAFSHPNRNPDELVNSEAKDFLHSTVQPADGYESLGVAATASLNRGVLPHVSALTRAGHVSVAVGHLVYVIGGFNQDADMSYPSMLCCLIFVKFTAEDRALLFPGFLKAVLIINSRDGSCICVPTSGSVPERVTYGAAAFVDSTSSQFQVALASSSTEPFSSFPGFAIARKASKKVKRAIFLTGGTQPPRNVLCLDVDTLEWHTQPVRALSLLRTSINDGRHTSVCPF